jgi:phospholipid/cholesterol/gamma-HCH transport system substrate-binding protein
MIRDSSFDAARLARWVFAALVLAAAIAGIARYRFERARYATYEIRTTDNVSGLMVDAPVEFHGVDVGQVERVALAGPALVSVRLRIRKDAPVSSATVATITARGLASKGFTGYVVVALEDDATAAAPLPVVAGADRQLRSAPSRSLNLDTAMNQVNVNVQAMTRLLQATLDEHSVAAAKQTLDNLGKVTRVLADNSSRMKSIADNFERASSRIDALLRSGTETAETVRTRLVPQANEAFLAVDGASAAWRRTAERTGSELAPLLAAGRDSAAAVQTQLLPQTYDAVVKLQTLTTTLDEFAQRLRHDPSLLLRAAAAPQPGPGEEP